MAVDSRDKRMSVIGLALPAPALTPNPDGSIIAADRGMLLWLYHGIVPGSPPEGGASFVMDSAVFGATARPVR